MTGWEIFWIAFAAVWAAILTVPFFVILGMIIAVIIRIPKAIREVLSAQKKKKNFQNN